MIIGDGQRADCETLRGPGVTPPRSGYTSDTSVGHFTTPANPGLEEWSSRDPRSGPRSRCCYAIAYN